ncbi:MAG: LysM peptidoglycan-binding domain-containing protein [Bacteroidota bacterium]
MKKLIALFLLLASHLISAQEYKTHKVSQDDTIESISKQYLVTASDLIALNPDANQGLKPNMVLIIPKSSINESEIDSVKISSKELVGFKKHRVKRKETLYSLSKEYGVSIDEIKKHNKRLYAENLRKGDRIQIPKYKETEEIPLTNTLQKYEVKPREGKWRIAYKFGITVPELEAMNPKMEAILQPGQMLNVPNISVDEEKKVDDEFNYYTVEKSEGYLSIFRKIGVTQEQLEELNPILKEDGLKLGMVLKVPGDTRTTLLMEDMTNTDLTTQLTNFNEKRIALMLPYRTHKLNMDSVKAVKRSIKTDALLKVSLDFHAGVLIALDSAKNLGISTNLKVFDTKNQASEVSKILRENDFTDYDAVIGPLLTANFDKVASELKKNQVPVLSPLTTPKNLYDNVYQTVPSKILLEETMIKFVKADSMPKNVVIVADSKNTEISNKLKTEFPTAVQLFSRKNKDGNEAYFIYKVDLEGVIKPGRNIIFLETENEGFASNVISMINGMNVEDTKIVLMTTNKTGAFDGKEISNYHLSNLKFHYPSTNKTTDVSTSNNAFVKSYRRIYNVSPNKYAIRGFDLTLDLLLRLAYAENLYDASAKDLETEYVENKFRYNKKLFGGYYNEAVYVVMFDELTIKEAKL